MGSCQIPEFNRLPTQLAVAPAVLTYIPVALLSTKRIMCATDLICGLDAVVARCVDGVTEIGVVHGTQALVSKVRQLPATRTPAEYAAPCRHTHTPVACDTN